jgi:hypothetical protein
MITISQLYLKSILPLKASDFVRTNEFGLILDQYDLIKNSFLISEYRKNYNIEFMLLAGTLAHTNSSILYESDQSFSEIGEIVFEFMELDSIAVMNSICEEAHNLFFVLIREWAKFVLKISKLAEEIILELWDVQNLCLVQNDGTTTIDREKFKIPISKVDYNIDLCIRFPLLWLNNICQSLSRDSSKSEHLNELDKLFYSYTEETNIDLIDINTNIYPSNLYPWFYRTPLKSIILNI